MQYYIGRFYENDSSSEECRRQDEALKAAAETHPDLHWLYFRHLGETWEDGMDFWLGKRNDNKLMPPNTTKTRFTAYPDEWKYNRKQPWIVTVYGNDKSSVDYLRVYTTHNGIQRFLFDMLMGERAEIESADVDKWESGPEKPEDIQGDNKGYEVSVFYEGIWITYAAKALYEIESADEKMNYGEWKKDKLCRLAMSL